MEELLTVPDEPDVLRQQCPCLNMIEWDDLALGYHRTCMRRLTLVVGPVIGG